MIDPYKIIGVAQAATQEEIKKNYRKLAKKYHPDLNPGNKEAEKKFKEISHAFDLIGTAEARGKFDRGETEEHQREQHEEYTQNKRTRRPSYYESQQDGGRYSYSFGEDLNASDFFEGLFAGRSGGGRTSGMQYPGDDVSFKLRVNFREAALSAEKTITLPDGKKLSLKIPAGIETGKRLRFKGLGAPGIGGGRAGDAYIEVEVEPLQGFQRNGKDIVTEVAVSFLEALTGADVEVPTIDGQVMLKIPPGVSTGTKLRIRGKGAGTEGHRGNQLVLIKVVMPKEVPAELALIAQDLRQKFDYNPRVR